MRKKFIIFSILLSSIIILISVLYIGNGITDTVKESSKLRVYILNNPLKLNIEWKDNILDVSLSSIYKAADYIKSFFIINVADRFMDTFVYRNVY
ncbi:MAG: hypothetical protein WCQ54_04165 [Clostridiaceae bacterium]